MGSYTLTALGGALDRKGVRPPIGGSSYVLTTVRRGRKIALAVDYGAYPLPEEMRRRQTDLVFSLEEQTTRYVEIGGLDFPVFDLDSNILEALEDNEILADQIEEFVPAHDVLEDADEIWVAATHGHVDHAGAIPYLDRRYPGRVRLLMTPATRAICEWSWYDSLQIASRKGHRLLYSASDVGSLLDRARIVTAGERMEIGPMQISFWSAGHISGAVSVLVRSPGCPSLFFTGDMSISDQLTVRGASLPDCPVDYLVCESTYGARASAKAREVVARELVGRSLAHLRVGGNVLLPALTVGRAWELLTIFKRYGVTDEFDVYLDGSAVQVATACAELEGDHSVAQHCITSWATRNYVMRSKRPSVVIVPSGMLMGGFALAYLRAWGGSDRNFIALSCYQQECSPGYRLLRTPPGSLVRVQGHNGAPSTFRLNASVAQYALSAHMDQKEILGVIEHLKPEGTFLVHGTEESMDAVISASSLPAQKTYIGEPIELV